MKTFEKIIRVIESCKTLRQLEVADKYVNIAMKYRYLNISLNLLKPVQLLLICNDGLPESQGHENYFSALLVAKKYELEGWIKRFRINSMNIEVLK